MGMMMMPTMTDDDDEIANLAICHHDVYQMVM